MPKEKAKFYEFTKKSEKRIDFCLGKFIAPCGAVTGWQGQE
jgi:hypothetical protein